MRIWVIFLLLLMTSATPASAALQSKVIEYEHNGVPLEGYLAYDDRFPDKRPGVLVIHEWWGINDYIKVRTDLLAALGYIAFAVDIYGKGIRPTTVDEADTQAQTYKKDRKLFRERLKAGLEELKAQPNVDQNRLAAVGFCFGGTGVLELARSGADVNGVVSFHGGLDSPNPLDAKNIKGKVLVLHGADDPTVKPEDIEAFHKEMKEAGIHYDFVSYPGAVHGFTNPDNKGEIPGVRYNADADAESWQAMKDFLYSLWK